MPFNSTTDAFQLQDTMIVERTFTPRLADGSGGDQVSSKEVFKRVVIFKPMDA